jgi:3',5'-cyclic AMP phosphodiesterase CpdA
MGLRAMIYRFIHLSDIHFGQEKGGTLVTHDHIRRKLTADVKDFARHHGPASRILITGDIAYSGLPDDYKKAATWLEELTTAGGCHDETHVSTIPGNHDCDLKADTHQAKMISAQLRASAPELARATLHEINQDGEAASPFLPKLKAYIWGAQSDSSMTSDFASAAAVKQLTSREQFPGMWAGANHRRRPPTTLHFNILIDFEGHYPMCAHYGIWGKPSNRPQLAHFRCHLTLIKSMAG